MPEKLASFKLLYTLLERSEYHISATASADQVFEVVGIKTGDFHISGLLACIRVNVDSLLHIGYNLFAKVTDFLQ